MAIKVQNTTVITDDKALIIGSGTTSQRPDVPADGMLRYNTDFNQYERYTNGAWTTVFKSDVGDTQAFLTSTTVSALEWQSFTTLYNGSIALQSSYPTIYAKKGLTVNGSLTTWTSVTSGTSSTITALFYANGLFLYGTEGGGLSTSTDGVTWTTRSSGAIDTISCFAYGNGVYAYGMSSGGANAGTSTDGITWSVRSTSLFYGVRAMAYGNGKFVMGGYSGNLSTTTDFINFSSTYISGSPNIFDVIYDGSKFVFIAFNRTGTSTDGITWTVRTAVGINGSNSGISPSLAYGRGIYAVAGDGLLGVSNNCFAYSTDLVNWTGVQIGYRMRDIVYANGLFVSVGGGGFEKTLYTSTNGITWASRSTASTSTLASVTYGEGLYIYGGLGGLMGSNYPFTYDINTEFVMPIIPNGVVVNQYEATGTPNLVRYQKI